jgi:flagellar protein FliS
MHGLQENYLESEVLAADPVRLVQLLYRGALDAVRTARAALQRGDIAGRSREVTKASAIINELALSLDHSKTPELSRTLVELYDYMQRRLNEANFQQAEPPLEEVERLLATLADAWQSAGRVEPEFPTPAGLYSPAVESEYHAVSYSY